LTAKRISNVVEHSGEALVSDNYGKDYNGPANDLNDGGTNDLVLLGY
jgi:hypothetical protein